MSAVNPETKYQVLMCFLPGAESKPCALCMAFRDAECQLLGAVKAFTIYCLKESERPKYPRPTPPEPPKVNK